MKYPERTFDARYLKGNVESARIILANRDRYKDGSIVVQWAEKVLARAEAAKDTPSNPLEAA